jgi:hypothetical protein
VNVPRRGAASVAALAVVAGLVVTFAAALAPAQLVVAGKDPEYPRIKYPDSLLSLNDRCIVRHGRLNPIFKPVYVNGRPIGFC